MEYFLPPPLSPPHDPKALRLSNAAGWRLQDKSPEIAIDACGSIALVETGSSAAAVDDPAGTLGGLVPPKGVVVDPVHGIIVLDPAGRRLRIFDPCTCRFRDVPCGSDDPSDRRHIVKAGGIAAGCGNLYAVDCGGPVSPAGSHTPRPPRPGRVLVFALPSLALRAILTPPPHAELAQPWLPVACAVAPGGALYVADPANGAIHHFNARHRWVAAYDGFGAVSAIAADSCGRLYTLVPGVAGVRISDRTGKPIGHELQAVRLRDRFAALDIVLASGGRMDLSALCRTAGNAADTAWFDAAGNPVAAPDPEEASFAESGTLTTRALDSRIGDCQWHALEIRGDIPSRSRVIIETLTLEVEWSPATIASLPPERWTRMATLRPTATGCWDGLILSPPGRYLWLRLTLEGKGEATPRLCLIDVVYPRISLRRYLPAMFGAETQSADLTDRLLAVFDSDFRSIERQIDTQPGLYDPLATPAHAPVRGRPAFLTWLAEWLGVRFDGAMAVAERRRLLKAAGALLGCTGTVAGLRQKLLVLLGIDGIGCCRPESACAPHCPPRARPYVAPPLVLEHFRLRRWLALGKARLGDTAMLWGERLVNRTTLGRHAQLGLTKLTSCTDAERDPWHVFAHRLTVFLPAARACTPARRAMIQRFLRAELPAHVEGLVEYVEPRFRIGMQASVGFDSVVARWPSGVTLGADRLGRATVLEADPAAGRPAVPRVGATTRLS